jgi:cysteine-rich repeat protein
VRRRQLLSNDGCNATCQDEFCGDGIIQSGIGEECDNAGANSDTTPDACRTNCALPSCGDGVVDPSNTEQCDDGNTKSNDDCLVQSGCLNAVVRRRLQAHQGHASVRRVRRRQRREQRRLRQHLRARADAGLRQRHGRHAVHRGTIGNVCTVNADCDVTLGDGVCTSEECDDGNHSNKDDCLNNCVDSDAATAS